MTTKRGDYQTQHGLHQTADGERFETEELAAVHAEKMRKTSAVFVRREKLIVDASRSEVKVFLKMYDLVLNPETQKSFVLELPDGSRWTYKGEGVDFLFDISDTK